MAAIVVLGDLLVCAALLLASIGAIGTEPTTRAEETAAWQSARKLYVGWLVIGAASFAVLRMPKALLAHMSTMLLSPIALFVLLLSPALA
ncbi:Integral membrane protein OS=Streptomyces fumanus OX=67302 GN=GCM10018772_10340 PE=4 SV=1 [Streptomyces fumanus]